MTRLAFALASCLAVFGVQAEDSISLDELLVAAKLPTGYEATTKPVKVGEKNLGRLIVVAKPNQIAKVIVRIELRDLTAVPARRAATAAYVNALATDLSQAGYKVVETNIPDMAKSTFESPISVGLVFANGEGKKLWTHQEIFFTNKGFVAQVIAEDPATLSTLTNWAKTIKPKTNP